MLPRGELGMKAARIEQRVGTGRMRSPATSDDFRRYSVAKEAKSQTIWLFLASTRNECDSTQLPLATAIRDALRDTRARLTGVDFFFLRGEKKRYESFSRAIDRFCNNCFTFRPTTPKELETDANQAAFREAPSNH